MWMDWNFIFCNKTCHRDQNGIGADCKSVVVMTEMIRFHPMALDNYWRRNQMVR